jgi:hypothetical protein
METTAGCAPRSAASRSKPGNVQAAFIPSSLPMQMAMQTQDVAG